MSNLFTRLSRFSWLALVLPVFAAPWAPGIKNFYQVDEHVYRGGQPTEEGFDYLSKIGVKTVIDLREADQRSKLEERSVMSRGMKYVGVPMTGLVPPTEPEIAKILAILEDASTGPVFVHCKRGADRTGAVIASYRIDQQHWDNARAFKEAMADGMSFFQIPRQNYIRTFRARSGEVRSDTAAQPAPVSYATAAVP